MKISTFYHALHGITALIIALFFFKRWFFLLTNITRCWRIIIKIMVLVALADSITLLFYLFFKWFGTQWFSLTFGFCITACALYSLRRRSWYPKKSWSYGTALLLGIVQGCALLPGISRMGATYVGARWLRLPPAKAFEISCLLEWPLITAAFLVSLSSLHHTSFHEQFLNVTTMLVILVSGCLAYSGLTLVNYLSDTQRMWWFSLYMILPIFLSVWLA